MSNEKKIPLLTAGLATIARHAHSLQGDRNLMEALDAIILGHAETVPVEAGRQPATRPQTAIEGEVADVAVDPTASDPMAHWRGTPEYLRVREEMDLVATLAGKSDLQSAMMVVEALVLAVLERAPVAPSESGWFIPDSALTEVQRVELEDAIRRAPNATDVRLLLLFSQGGMRRDIPWLRHLRRAEDASSMQQSETAG